jgi:hypothetical protein
MVARVGGMIFTATRLADAFVIDVELHADERGFPRSYIL